MRKALTIIGKALMLFGLLWPLPMGFIAYPIFEKIWDMPMWSVNHGFWWPVIGIFALGLIMCLFARYQAKRTDEELVFHYYDNPGFNLLKLVGWTLVAIGGFMLLVMLIIGLWWLFLTENIEWAVPMCAGIGIVGALIFYGVAYYKNHDK